MRKIRIIVIDLAVWGIPPDMYFKAVAEIISLSSKFKIDVIDPEDCRDSKEYPEG